MKYPIGVQDFESLRQDGYLYVDKTALIYKLVSTGRYYFLSRPRRFGKSLLVSTLAAYFRGKKELFKGLAMEELEKDWTIHPVLHLDFNTGRYNSAESLYNRLDKTLRDWEAVYGRDPQDKTCDIRFESVVERACKQTGQRVVILIDEYDKPLLQNIGNDALQEELRNILRSFYSVIKTQDRYIKFGLLTGVSKFGKLSVFSDLNSPKEISMDARYAELCGITEAEIHKYLEEPLHEMAERNGKTYEEMCQTLKERYDGYHFEYNTVGVYNPYSLLNAFDSMTLKDYWFETGTPSSLIRLLKKTNYDLNKLTQEQQTADMLNSIDSANTDPIPLIYQSGYLTIKGYDERFGMYKLGFPNKEVENGFVRYLLPYYSPIDEKKSDFFILNFVKEIEDGDIESFMERLQALFADNSYQVMGKMELYFQNTMFVIFKMLGFFTEVERTTHRGRIDIVIKTKDYIYIIEIKLDGSADEALKQIEEKGYAEPYAKDSRELFKVGVNFASDIKGIKEWKIG